MSPLDGLRHYLGKAVRQFRRSPGFAATIVITLALGIGATTAIFTLLQQVMLRSLPVARPEQLWLIGDGVRCCYVNQYSQEDWSLFSWDAFQFFRAGTPEFESLAAFQIGVGNGALAVRRAGSRATAQTRLGEYVSGNFFETLGISAWRGRLLTDADDNRGAPPVVVMSFHTWQEKYGSDPSIIGGAFQLNGRSFTLVGITPPGFFGVKITAEMPDVWLPLSTEPLIAGGTSRLNNPRLEWLDLIGRVPPGTNLKSLNGKLQVELRQWLTSHLPEMSLQEKALLKNQSLHLSWGGGGVSLLRQQYQDDLLLLLLAALCVLLVACTNIANLLLARGLKERHQTALCAALGASPARLVWEALAQSLTLAVFGGAAGVAVAYALAKFILHLTFVGADSWIPVNATPSFQVLLFGIGVSIVTGIIFGMAPAWISLQADPIEAMRGANRSVKGDSRFAQKTLVIVQAAVSVVLLSTATMLGQSLRNLENHNFGFETRDRYLISIDPKISNYKEEQLVPLFREMEGRLRAIPGVRKVSSVLEAPMDGWVWPQDVRVQGRTEEYASSGWTRVTPGFFETLGVKLFLGRPISERDNSDTEHVAVVNEAFVRRFFGTENPIGHHFGPATGKNDGVYKIVGVVRDIEFGARAAAAGVGPSPMYFLPEAQGTKFDDPESKEREVWSHYLYSVVIWAPGKQAGLAGEVRRSMASLDPNLVVNDVRAYSEVIHAEFAQQNMIASLSWLFGAVALLLAIIGLYGVTAYDVEQRTGEIGIRMALGGTRVSLLLMILRGAFWQVGVGLVLGIPAAIGVGHFIASRLFGVSPWDPLTLLLATLLLGLATLIAGFIPARCAANVDPMQALRSE